jgi:prepilin-type N-terminal cleavage/methylation domain-containing protein
MTNRGDNQTTTRSRQAGFGLVELVVALAVSSVGAVALAGAGLAIGEQGRTARWSADQGLVARTALETAHRLGHGAVPAGSSTVGTGTRSYSVRTVVTPVGRRLDAVRLDIAEPGRTPASYETRVASARPLPVAP